MADRPYEDVCESCPCSAWQTLHHGNVCVEIIQSPSYLPPTRNIKSERPPPNTRRPLSVTAPPPRTRMLRHNSILRHHRLPLHSDFCHSHSHSSPTPRAVMVYCCDAYAITSTLHSPRSVGPGVNARSEMLAVADVSFISAPAKKQPKRQHPLFPVSLRALACPRTTPASHQ